MNMERTKSSKGKVVLWCVIGMIIFAAVKSLGNGDEYNENKGAYKTACETAELAVQSKKVGAECPTEGKVVYANDRDIVVAVKYWITEETKDTYWITFVQCYGEGEYWHSMIDGNGIDYDNIPQDVIDDLKIKWELK